MTDTDLKKTPLYNLHVELGAKMVDFAGWSMPVQYAGDNGGIMNEHAQCRNKAALFDVSHMGQVILTGDNPAKAMETLVPAALTELAEGRARYTFFTNAAGGILDDLIVSNAGDHLFVVVNAALRDQDIPYMRKELTGLDITEIHDRALIAVQGPAAEKVVAKHCPSAKDMIFMQTEVADIMGVECRVSRLGYTGEDGYEISIPNAEAERITRAFLDDPDCEPAGLGARDSLRLEAGLCLYGNDIDTETSPIEASLLWAIQKRRRADGGFPGAARIQNEIENGATRKLVGIAPDGRAPARRGVEIQCTQGNTIGIITSGGFSPTLQRPVAMGYVLKNHSTAGEQVNLMIRGQAQPAKIAPLPFVQQNYKR